MKSKTNNYKSYKVNKVNERGDDSSGNNTQCFTIQYVPMNREWPCIFTMYRELCIHLLYVLNGIFKTSWMRFHICQILWLLMTVVNEFMLFCVLIIVAINYDCSAMLSENLKATEAKALN